MNSVNIFEELGQGFDSENWFTNCLCTLLNSDNRLTTFLLRELLKSDRRALDGVHFNARTQVALAETDRIADIELLDEEKRFYFLIEDKVDAPVDTRQLQDQLETIKAKSREGSESYLVLLTRKDEFTKVRELLSSSRKMIYIRWNTLYSLLENYRSKRRVNGLVEPFLRYMEDSDFSPPKSFERRGLNTWGTFIRFRRTAESMLDMVVTDITQIPPRFQSGRGYGETYAPEPYMGYYLYPEEFYKLKRKSECFKIWFGFLHDIRTRKTYLEVETLFYPTEKFFKKTVRRYLSKSYDQWSSRLKAKGWTFYHEDEGSVHRFEEISTLIGRTRQLASQQRKVKEFIRRALLDLDEVGTYGFVKKALKVYAP